MIICQLIVENNKECAVQEFKQMLTKYFNTSLEVPKDKNSADPNCRDVECVGLRPPDC